MTTRYPPCRRCERVMASELKRGLCVTCYKLWRVDPSAVPQIGGDGRRAGSKRERFLSKIVPGPQACAIWVGTLDREGYGKFALDGYRPALAHRFGYELLIGPIPDGMQLDHTCHNRDVACPGGATCLHRRCVNPHHLEPVTGRENSGRAASRRNGGVQ